MDAAIEIDNKRDGEHEYGCRYRYRYGYAFGLRFRFRPIAENCSDCARQTPVGIATNKRDKRELSTHLVCLHTKSSMIL